MPIGVLNKNEALEELRKVGINKRNDDYDAVGEITSIKRRDNGEDITELVRGRGNVLEVPESLRKVIGEEALLGSHASDIADAFGVSKSSISAYKRGATSTTMYNKRNKSLALHIDNVKSRIRNKAAGLTAHAMSNITPEKLALATLRENAIIADTMANIMKKMSPDVENHNGGTNIQFVVHAPEQRKEESYTVINVKE